MNEPSSPKSAKCGVLRTVFYVVSTLVGLVFLLAVAALGYLWFADPWSLKPVFFPQESSNTPSQESSIASPSEEYDHPLLNTTQEALADKFGIDTKNIPEKITPEMYDCAVRVLGEARVKELQAGGEFTPGDFFKARSCLAP